MRARAVAAVFPVALVGLAVLGAGAARGETPIPPAPARFVTDQAAFLSPATAMALEGRLAGWSARTGHQLIVYIDRTTDGVPIEDWAVRAFESWRVGRKGIDDGLALFIFSADRRLRVEVGYGLEDRVPDLVAGRIISEMGPRIRAGDNDGAVQAGVDRLMAVVGDAPATVASPARVAAWKLVLGGLALLFFVGFLVTHPSLAFLMMMNIGGGGRGGGFGGGGFGGGGGGFGGGRGGFSGGGGRSGGGGASGSW